MVRYVLSTKEVKFALVENVPPCWFYVLSAEDRPHPDTQSLCSPTSGKGGLFSTGPVEPGNQHGHEHWHLAGAKEVYDNRLHCRVL